MRQAIASMSGFRCVPEFPIDAPFFRRVGRNIASRCAQPVAIGWDTRVTSNDVVKSISAGLSEAGARYTHLGLATSPLVSFGAKGGFYRTGVMITSSHNPPEWNGIKVFGQDGTILDEPNLKELIEGGSGASASPVGPEGPRGCREVLEAYMDSILKTVLDLGGSADGLHVVLDAGNGPAVVTVPRCLERLGAQVTLINDELDGLFRRQIEPRPEALSVLSETVADKGADVGVAFDSDGDRAVLVDEKGRVLDEDLTLALACDLLLERLKCPVVVNVATSMLLDFVCEKHGVKLFRSAVGERNVVEEMRRVGSTIGGEGSCGGLIYLGHSPTRDGCLSAGLVASILRRSGDSISSLVSAYPSLKRGRASVEVAPGLAGRVMEEVELIAHGPEPMKLDGLRFSGAGWWVLVRPSRTEPIIRVMAEGTDERQVRELVEDYTSVVRQACGRLGREVRR
jgi:phosphomannomutase